MFPTAAAGIALVILRSVVAVTVLVNATGMLSDGLQSHRRRNCSICGVVLAFWLFDALLRSRVFVSLNWRFSSPLIHQIDSNSACRH